MAAKSKDAEGQRGRAAEPVVLSKKEFLTAFENGDLQRRLAEYYSVLGIDVPHGVLRSWNNSYAFLDIVLRGNGVPDDVTVLCEYPTDFANPASSKRMDAVLIFPPTAESSECAAIVIELKQWDEHFLEKDYEDDNRKNPFDQAYDYASAFLKQGYDGRRLRVYPVVFLHNMPSSRSAEFELLSNTHDDVHGFYRGQIGVFQDFIVNVGLDDAEPPTRALKRAQQLGYWKKTLPSSAGELRTALIEGGYARSLLRDRYDYEPTSKGEKIGIVRYEGYDTKKERYFVICHFSDKCMRELAKRLSKK